MIAIDGDIMRFKEVQCREPLREGCVPKDYGINREGKLCEIIYEPEDYKPDPEIVDTETYYTSGREEYWDYETTCKACGTKFMAYGGGNLKGYEPVRNYCPGCGRKLQEDV